MNSKGEIQERQNFKNNKILPHSEFPVKFANLGLTLIMPLLIGIFLGKYIDQRFQTGTKAVQISIFVAVIIIFYNLYQFIKDASSNNSSRPH